jgi:uncharacterized protein
MVIAVLQFELLMRGAESLKDKRRVVASVKDRLHREHQVSVAEVGLQDRFDAARLGLALVATDGRYAGQVLDRVTAKLRDLREAELGDTFREILHDPRGDDADAAPAAPAIDPDLAREVIDRAPPISEDPA